MAPGPVRWPWIASSVPSETFFAGVRFRGWMSEAGGFLCSRLPASLTWPARSGLISLSHSRPSWPSPRSRPDAVPLAPRPALPSHRFLRSLASRKATASLVPRRDRYSTHVSADQGAPSPGPRPAGVQRLPRPMYRAPPGRRTPSPGRTDPGHARGAPARRGGQIRGSVSMVFRVCCRIVTC